VSTVSLTVVAPEETLTVTGKDFNPTTSYNRVRFNNPLASVAPFEGTTTRLRVVVPQNAATGPVSVKVPNQPQAGVGPEVEVTHGVGDVWVLGGSGSVRLPTPAGAKYLVVPYATGGQTTENHIYMLNAAPLPPASTATAEAKREQAPPELAEMTAVERFESWRWDAGRELAEREGIPRAMRRPGEATSAAPQEIRQFNVWNTIDENASLYDPANYTQIQAELRYTGQHCLIYTDLDSLTTGNLTWADLKSFADRFDVDIRPSNNKYFGTENDVDGNGKVIIVITPVVNLLTPNNANYFIGGFFIPIDLYRVGGNVPAGTTNHAEAFYILAADPDSTYSAPSARSRADVAVENIKTIVHEYEHLISFSYRLSHYGAPAIQLTWLEEGMAHVAEDLLSQETGEPTLNDANWKRGQRYRSNTGFFSLEDSESPVGQRGGIYLFLRLLGDRFDDTIYKQILQSSCLGRSCIESVTGRKFDDLMGDFLAAMYMSGRGINLDAAYNYQSIDLADFGALPLPTRSIDGVDHSDVVRRSTGDFFVFQSSPQPECVLTTFTSSSTMGMRTVIVRIP